MDNETIKTLLVEDDPDDVRMVRQMLTTTEGARFHVECADRLSTGITLLAEDKSDVVLLDLWLPDSQGLDTLRKVLTQAPQTPVVVLTSMDDTATAVEAVREGAQDYLVKGQVDSNLLARCIQYAIERRRAEEALSRSDEFCRTILDSMNDAVSIISVDDNRILGCNRVFLEQLGLKEDEVIGKPCYEITYRRSDPCTPRDICPVRADTLGEEHSVAEHVHHRADGEEMCVEVSASPIKDESGRTIQAVLVSRDISSRRRDEEALRESEEKFRSLAERSPNMIFINHKGRVVYANEKCEEILGYEREELCSPDFDFYSLIAPECIDLVRAAYGKHMKGEEVPPYEYALLAKEGERIEAINATRLTKYNGESAILGVVTDITERKRAEQALLETKEWYRDLYEEAPIAYFTVGVDGHIRTANRSACDLLGYTVDELVGRPVFDLYAHTPAGKEKARETFKRFRAGGDIGEEELEMRRADGRPVWISLSVRSVRNGEGRIVESRSMVLDITERKRAEEELEQSLGRLQRMLGGTVNALAAMAEKRDPSTAGHQQRVAQLASAIGEEMGLSEERIEGIQVAGIVHDIGKMYVPAGVLNKSGKLTGIEFAMIKAHPQAGYDILKTIEFPWPVAEIVLQHHERMDGSGYPHGLRASDILVEARIIAVADVVEAMVSHRPYRPAHATGEAFEEITENKGTLYDSEVVDAGLKVIMERGVQFR